MSTQQGMDWGKHPASMMEHPHQRELKTEAKAYDVPHLYLLLINRRELHERILRCGKCRVRWNMKVAMKVNKVTNQN